MSLVQRRFRVLKGLRFYDIMFFLGDRGVLLSLFIFLISL
jgi:hypothetical protein